MNMLAFKIYTSLRYITFSTSIELHSHGDMLVPSPWMNPDVTRYYSWEQTILDNGILISVSCKILE